MKMQEAKGPNILIVDDRPENLLVLEILLEDMDCQIIKANSGNEALGLMLEYEFALVLLDVQMPEMDGFETAELMRGTEKTRYLPIVFVTALSKEKVSMFKGYEVGAVDYLYKPIEAIILKSKVRIFIELFNQKKLLEEQSALLVLKIKELTELKDANFELENLSFTDGLTGIANRRSFDEYIEMAWKNARRSQKPISLIMGDIDNFKLLNDRYGHLKGDDCLIEVARSLTSSLKRPMDFVARYGGEEFIMVLPETNSEDAYKIGEEIRIKIKALEIPNEDSLVAESIMTMSFGLATTIPNREDRVEDFIDLSDKALYQSKATGKNKVTLYED